MPNPNSEENRLRSLRDRQLADRDPHTKQREFYRQSSQREKNYVTPFSLKQAWSEIPHKWKVPFYGLVLGVLVFFVVTTLWISPWAMICSLVAILVFVGVGFLIGRAMDTRDELRDLTR